MLKANKSNVGAVSVRERENTSTQALKALWVLSGFSGNVDAAELSGIIGEAPDPETACRVIISRVRIESEALRKKWRKVISETWFSQHPHVSSSLDIPLMSTDVAGVAALRDARFLLEELHEYPAQAMWENGEKVLHFEEMPRLMAVMSSLKGASGENLESEWSCVPLRRLRDVLQALRLVRVFNGEFVVVKSRYERFLRLPVTQQFYALWHADVYHIDWSDYAGHWAPYMAAMQNYLPLLWEIANDAHEGEIDNVEDMTNLIVDIFTPVWEQEGLLTDADHTFFELYEQSSVPGVIKKMIISDLFVRYGLIEMRGNIVSLIRGFGGQVAMENHDAFTWTAAGSTLLSAERERELPCAFELHE